MQPQPSKRKASEKSADEERSKNSPEEGAGEALIEVGEKGSAIIIRRDVLTRRVEMAGGWPRNHHMVDGEDVVIEM